VGSSAFLPESAAEFGIVVSAVHFNHTLREVTSPEGRQAFVKDLRASLHGLGTARPSRRCCQTSGKRALAQAPRPPPGSPL